MRQSGKKTIIGQIAFIQLILSILWLADKYIPNKPKDDGLRYDFQDTSATITGTHNSYPRFIKIPEQVSHDKKVYPVTSIGKGAFKSFRQLDLIIIPNSVTSIGERAFFDCEYLHDIRIPNSVTSIGEEAFKYCYALSYMKFPDSISIGQRAFNDCDLLRWIQIHNSTTIGKDAFTGCDMLTAIYCQSNTPPVVYGEFFEHDKYATCTLYIPEGEKVLQSYENTEPWCNFQNIVQLKQADFPSSL